MSKHYHLALLLSSCYLLKLYYIDFLSFENVGKTLSKTQLVGQKFLSGDFETDDKSVQRPEIFLQCTIWVIIGQKLVLNTRGTCRIIRSSGSQEAITLFNFVASKPHSWVS